jgi:hypothetical protein
MFDTIGGLPVHALVVHLVVVLLPVAAVLTAVVALVPGWRGPALRWVVGVDAGVVLLALTAGESGERLQERLSRAAGRTVAAEHAELGGVVPYVAAGVLLAAVLVLVASRRGGTAADVAAWVAVAVAVTAVGWVLLAAHSGTESVWRDQISGTDSLLEDDPFGG